MRRTTILACAILILAGRLAVSATTQPADAAKSPQYSGKMADGTRIDFARFPDMKLTFSNGWTVTTLTPGVDRAGRRVSGIGKAGHQDLTIAGVVQNDRVSLRLTVGVGKAATTESVMLEKTKADAGKKRQGKGVPE
jgi:hypothetical protein